MERTFTLKGDEVSMAYFALAYYVNRTGLDNPTAQEAQRLLKKLEGN